MSVTRSRRLRDRGKVVWLQSRIADVSTASTIAIPVPETGVITEVQTCLGSAISVADATITLTNGGSTWGGGTITIAQSGSATGDVDSQTGLEENVTAGSYVSVATDGGSTTAATLDVQLKLVIRDGEYK